MKRSIALVVAGILAAAPVATGVAAITASGGDSGKAGIVQARHGFETNKQNIRPGRGRA